MRKMIRMDTLLPSGYGTDVNKRSRELAFSILIPTWNGRPLLDANLPYVLDACGSTEEGAEVIVGDDGSTDGTADWLGKVHASVQCVRSEQNTGFAEGVNRMASVARGELIYLLNNDARPDVRFLEGMADAFRDPSLFALGSVTSEDADRGMLSYPRVKPRLGLHYYRYDPVPLPAVGLLPVGYVSGGHACFRKGMFLALGGLDERLGPFYLEDQDLCLRARARGWKILVLAGSRVTHAGQGTIRKHFSQEHVLSIHWRNRFILSRTNYRRIRDRLGRFLSIPALLVVAWAMGRRHVVRGYRLSRRIDGRPTATPTSGRPTRFFPKRETVLRWCGPNGVRILVVHQHAIIGGAERSLSAWIEKMPMPFTPEIALGEEGPMAASLREKGMSVHLVPFPPIKANMGASTAGAVFRLAKLARECRAALIHANTPRTNLISGLAGRLTHTPVIWHARNLIYGNMRDTDRLLMWLPSRIVCNSRAIERRFHRRGIRPGHVRTVYSGVDTDLFHPGGRTDAFRKELGVGADQVVIGMVGRIGLGKGQDTFLRAVRRARDLGSQARFIIVGGSQHEDEKRMERNLLDQARSLRLEGDLLFTGFRSDMPAVMAGLDVVALCTEAEPFARVVLEAMSCGTAVVGTDSGGTPEMIEEGISGRLFPAGDADRLANICVELEGNPEMRERLGGNARRAVLQRFSLDRHVREMSDLYYEVLTES